MRSNSPQPISDAGGRRLVVQAKVKPFKDDLACLTNDPRFGEDDVSLENNTHIGRKREIKSALKSRLSKKTISVLREAKPVAQISKEEFLSQSCFFVDTLRESLCEREAGQWYVIKDPFNLKGRQDQVAEQLPEPDRQAKATSSDEPAQVTETHTDEPITNENSKGSSAKHQGRWTPDEHQRFLEAVKLFGKEWEKIERHIGTRDVHSIRNHAQKFLVRLVRFLEGKARIKDLSMTDAEYFYGVLNQKMHKAQFLERQRAEREQKQAALLEQQLPFLVERGTQKGQPQQPLDGCHILSLRDDQSGFQKWTTSQKGSLLSSLKIASKVYKALSGSYFKFSFQSILQQNQEAAETDDAEVLSQVSTGSYFRFRFKQPTRPSINRDDRSTVESRFREAIDNLEDIDSDDEDPLILQELTDMGLTFNFMANVTPANFLKQFFMLKNGMVDQKLKNLRQHLTRRVNQIMEQEGSFGETKAHSILSQEKILQIDLSKAVPFFARYCEDPSAIGESGIRLAYLSQEERKRTKWLHDGEQVSMEMRIEVRDFLVWKAPTKQQFGNFAQYLNFFCCRKVAEALADDKSEVSVIASQGIDSFIKEIR